MDRITLPRADDLHVHLRDGELCASVTPLTYQGGAGRVLVMPNLTPPVDSVAAVRDYRERLRALEPRLDYLMTLYLSDALRPDALDAAREAGVVGVKRYPRGVTTNSESGQNNWEAAYPLIKRMQELDLVLELHGEVPSDPDADICVLNAEERFLDSLQRLHRDFPRLRIVLEHVTSAAAVDCVRSLGATVAATITVHHLDLTVDDWAGRNHNFCKPVAKYPHDRDALRAVLRSGHPRFFLGSDSAPHPRSAKEGACGCAGVFTAPLLLPYLADCCERLGCLEQLRPFASERGAAFYGLPPQEAELVLERREQEIPSDYGGVVPFRAGERLCWRLAE